MGKKIRIILMSGSQTGCEYTEFLKSSSYAELDLIVTGVDKPSGRDRAVKRARLAEYCDIKGIDVFQPENVNWSDSLGILEKHSADMALVVDYGQILSRQVLNIFPIGAFNIHYSILPDLRGAAPVRWALLKGYRRTGVTLMKMNEKIDAGEIVNSKFVKIDEMDNYQSLKKRLTQEGIKLIGEFLKKIIAGENIEYIPQKITSNLASAPKIGKEFCAVDWKLTSSEIVNRIRALNPYPGCCTMINKKNGKIKIIMARDKKKVNGVPGEVYKVTKGSFTVYAGKGGVEILELQPSGKRVMNTRDFLAGNFVKVRDKFL